LGFPFGGADEKEIVTKEYTANSFVIALPEGKYEFCDFRLSGASGAYSTQIYQPKTPFGIGFQVVAGKVNYVGRYFSANNYGKNALGMWMPTIPYWIATDAQAEDMPYILKRDPALSARPLVSTVPAEETLLRPFFSPKLLPQPINPVTLAPQ
jgi:hypothetical protein